MSETSKPQLNHIDTHGNAIMVDVGAKDITQRIAVAGGRIAMLPATIGAFADGRVRIEDKRLYAGDEALEGPYDLSAQVDASLE